MEYKAINTNKQGKSVSEYDLEEIFFVQYNDLFSKLLLKTLEEFLILLKKQVLFHLKIIDKQYDYSLITFFNQKYNNICQSDKLRIQNIYQEILNIPEQNLTYLKTLEIYIHCNKCKDAIHKCGNKLINYNNLFFCLKCKKVYNQNQIKLFCKGCHKTYLTTKRSIKDQEKEYFYSVSYMNYHCFLENEEKIKCLNCGDDLYYNITKTQTDREKKGIRDIYCIKCKLIFDTKQIFFKCKICGENFKSSPQIYRNISSIKKYLLLLVHTFRKGIYATPSLITDKKCNCNLKGILYYTHNDSGTLFEGKKNGKKVIICNYCYGIYKRDNFIWNCPFCKISFKSINEHSINASKRRKNISTLKKQKDMLFPTISHSNMCNSKNKDNRNNKDLYASVVFQSDSKKHDYNTSRQLTNSASTASFVHNRGLSLNPKINQRIDLNANYNDLYGTDLNNNNITNDHNKDNKIVLKIGHFGKSNSLDEYFNENYNEIDQNLKGGKDIKIQNNFNNGNAIFNYKTNNNDNNGLKRSVSNFDKIYHNPNNINFFNDIINNYNIININQSYNNNHSISKNKNIDKNSIKLPLNQEKEMKVSKSHYNINQPIDGESNQTPRIQESEMFEKKFGVNALKNNSNNNNNININISNNLIKMNYSLNSNSQNIENNMTMPKSLNRKVIKRIVKKDMNKFQNIKIINNINDINSDSSNNSKIYKKKKMIEQSMEKDMKHDLKNEDIKNRYPKEINDNILLRSMPNKIESKQNDKKESIIKKNKNAIKSKSIIYNNINIIKGNNNNTNKENNNINININTNININENNEKEIKKRYESNNKNDKPNNTPNVITKIRIINKGDKTPQNKRNIIKSKNNNFRNQSMTCEQLDNIKVLAKQKVNPNNIKIHKNENDIALNNLKNNSKSINNIVYININNKENKKNKSKKAIINKTEITQKKVIKEKELKHNHKVIEKGPLDSISNKKKKINNNNYPRDNKDNTSNNIRKNMNELFKIEDEEFNNNLAHKKNNLSLNLYNISKNDFKIKKTVKNNSKENKIINKIDANNINYENNENSKNKIKEKNEIKMNNNNIKNMNDNINIAVNGVKEIKLNDDASNDKKNKLKLHNSIKILNNNKIINDNININSTPNKNISKSLFNNYIINNESTPNNNMKKKVNNNAIKKNIIEDPNLRKNIAELINPKNNLMELQNNLNNNININSNINNNIIYNIGKNDDDAIHRNNNILNNINNNNSNNIKYKIINNNSNKKTNNDNNSNIIKNKFININEDINKSQNRKILGSNNYKNISKSTNQNLLIKSYNNNDYNDINTNSNKPIVDINTNLNNIITINNNINQKYKRKENSNYENDINLNININNTKDHPQDTIVKNNKITLNKSKNNKNIIAKDNSIEPTKEVHNVNQNSNKKIVINNNLKENNKIKKQKKKKNIKEVSNVLELKKYFALMGKEKDQNIKRKLSFDCRQSKNHFKFYNNQDIEMKTFDSNYYKIIRPIGKGTYGEIYLVQDPKTLALFALKKIVISDALELKDNQEEYKLTWQLTHANPLLKIVKKYAIEIKKLDKYNLVMYILMEAANCDWEHELLNRQKVNAFYTEAELLTILKSLVETFLVLQNKGISHRDVKPQNILCFGNEGYKLSDFGEAKKNKKQIGLMNMNGFEQNTSKQTVRGTELYMSPILFKALRTKKLYGTQYNAYKSDVFSLGMCFLLASSLNYQSLIEIREVLDMKIIEGVVNKYLGKLYSKNYINLIINMLQTDEKIRPDFIELSSIIVKYFN